MTHWNDLEGNGSTEAEERVDGEEEPLLLERRGSTYDYTYMYHALHTVDNMIGFLVYIRIYIPNLASYPGVLNLMYLSMRISPLLIFTTTYST